ncbi:MAG: hypothetical protein LBM41_02735 [Ruminococcus sp.]|nr:hypothetical protein [Ruminococcus sp.]
MGLFSSLLNSAVRTGVSQVIGNSNLSDVKNLFGGNTPAASTATQRDTDLYSIIINGKQVTIPIKYDEFLAVTGLRQHGEFSKYGVDVTDGYSTFFVGVKDNYVRDIHVYLMGVNDYEDAFDPTKSQIVFPGGLTFGKTKAEIAGLYPFKNKGTFVTDTEYDDMPADVWTIDPEKDKSTVLVIRYTNFDKDVKFGSPSDTPTSILFFFEGD